MTRSRQKRTQGFTLIELMIVISLMLILVSIAVPAYNQSILHSREAVMRQNLFSLRSLISQYSLDKQKEPQALEDLIQAGYIRQIPNDPMTGKPDWTPDQDDNTQVVLDQQESGIVDVHSSSAGVGSDGTAYNTW